MGSTTAYACDGPECHELTERAPGTQAPQSWPRVTVKLLDGTKTSGSFHNIVCAHLWLDLVLPPRGSEV